MVMEWCKVGAPVRATITAWPLADANNGKQPPKQPPFAKTGVASPLGRHLDPNGTWETQSQALAEGWNNVKKKEERKREK